MAIRSYAGGALDEALENFRLAQNQGPLTTEQSIFLMRTEYRLGKYPDALETIRHFLRDAPGHPEALKTGGRIANFTQDVSLAKEFWQKLANSDPADQDAPLQLARIAYRERDFKEAALWASRFLALAPSHPEGLSLKLAAALNTRDLNGMGELLARYFTVERDKALVLLRQLSEIGEHESYGEALHAIEELAGDDPQIAQRVADTRENFLVGGLHAEIQARDAEAARFFRALRALQPDSADAQKGLERLRRYAVIKMRESSRAQQRDQVIEFGRQALAIDPQCVEGWRTLGCLHFLAAEFVPARDCFRHWVELSANDTWAWLNYARSLDRLDEWKAALAAYRRVIELAATANPDYFEESSRAIRALYAKALSAARQAEIDGDIGRAWQHCEVAHDIEPENEVVAVLVRRLLSAMHAAIRRLWNEGSADAIDLGRRYIERDPDNTYVLQVLGRTLMNTRRYAEARPVWQRLAALEPGDAHFRLQIARCCNWLKLREDGLAAVREVLALDPNLAEAKTIAEQLEALAPTA